MLRYARNDSPKKGVNMLRNKSLSFKQGGQHPPEWQVVFKAIFTPV